MKYYNFHNITIDNKITEQLYNLTQLYTTFLHYDTPNFQETISYIVYVPYIDILYKQI